MINVNESPIQQFFLDSEKTKLSPVAVMFLTQLARVAQGKDVSAVNASLLEGHPASYFLAAANATPRRCGDGTNNNEQTITSAGSLTLAHNLVGVTDPVLIQVDVYLICKTEEAGYAVGNRVKVPVFFSVFTTSDIPRGMSLTVDSANLNIRYGNASTVYELVNKTSGAMTNATNANWKAIFVARI